jgi:hypothetical protein
LGGRHIVQIGIQQCHVSVALSVYYCENQVAI